MKWWSVFAFIGVCAAYSASANLLQVNDKNFREVVIDSGKYVFVDFYADWCRHCKKLMPVIEQLADVFEPYDNVEVVKINGDTDGKRMSKKYVEIGYPTMLLFHGDDSPVEFSGSRDLESISNFVQAVSGVRVTANDAKEPEEPVKQPEYEDRFISAHDFNFDDVVDVDKASVVVFSLSQCYACQGFWPVLEELATVYAHDDNDVQFVSVTTDEGNSTSILLETYGIKRIPSVVFLPKLSFAGEDGRPFTMHQGPTTLDVLVEKVNELANLHRNTDGELNEHAGRVEALDHVVKEYRGDGSSMLEHFEKITGQYDAGVTAYYRKLINKVINGESDFFASEMNRLSGILENDVEKLNRKTVELMQRRLNVLRVFA